MKITVFTPTYNRKYILGNLYRSLQRQSCFDFEWLIVDDGSTDNTGDLVFQWIQEQNNFPIRYFMQNNGGKCRAINRGLQEARGDLFLVIDSDDYLIQDAIQKIIKWERELPKEEKYCAVAGNLGTSESETPNRLFDGGFFTGTLLDRYRCVNGERAIAFYTDVHRQYFYPVFEGETFMTEAVAYNRMAHDGYKTRFYNDIICVYDYLDDGLTKTGYVLFLKNPRGYALWLRERQEFMGISPWKRFRLWYSYYCEMSFCVGEYRLSKKACAKYIGAPIAAVYTCATIHKLRSLTKGC